MQINTKRKFFDLWKQGLLGNHTRVTTDPHVAFNWNCPEIGFREQSKAGGGWWTKVARVEVFITYEAWKSASRTFTMDDACPNHLTTLCGEVCRTVRGLEGHLAVEPRCGMRQAFLTPRSPLTTLSLIRHYMDSSSQEDLNELLELYPDHAIEFSCFTVNVGVFPHRNTIFWETRCY